MSDNPPPSGPPQAEAVPVQAIAIDSQYLAGILSAMQQQNAQTTAQLDLLRQQIASSDAARQASEAASQQLIADQSAALQAVQQQQAQDFQSIAASFAASGPNQGLPPDVLPPKSYPKIEPFKIERNEDSASRLKFFVFRNALQNRLELHSRFRAACFEAERLKAGDTPAAIQASIKVMTETYARALNRKPPASDVLVVGPGSNWVHEADKYLAELLIEHATAVTFQLAFQNHRAKLNKGAYCFHELREIFDPQDLAAALVVLTQFTKMQCTGDNIAQHCTDALQAHRDLTNTYWSDALGGPDYKQMVDELSATIFIRSLPSALGKYVRRELKVGPRKDYNLIAAIDSAKSDRNLAHAIAEDKVPPDRRAPSHVTLLADVGSDSSDDEFAMLARRQRDPEDELCTNCNRTGHTRGRCPKPCKVPIGLTDARLTCNGIAPNHNPACILSKESTDARKAKKQARRADRSQSRVPPAYQRQRQRPNRSAQIAGARANLAQVKTFRKQTEAVISSADTPELRQAHLAQLAEINDNHDEIVSALAQLQGDHDPLGPMPTDAHDADLAIETRVPSASTVETHPEHIDIVSTIDRYPTRLCWV